MKISSQKWFLAVVSGLLFIPTLPIAFFSPEIDPRGYGEWLAWVFLVPYLWAIREETPRQAAKLGWVCGWIMYSGTQYWVVVAMHEFGLIPLVPSILIMLLQTGYCALYVAMFGYLFTRYLTKYPPIVTVPVLWIGLEYLRGILFTGFPWSHVGYTQYLRIPLIQIADLVGVHGVGALVMMVNGFLFGAIRLLKCNEKASENLWKKGWVPGGVVVIVLLLTLAYGTHRLSSLSPGEHKLKVALVQGNIPQDLKWNSLHSGSIISIYRDLMLEADNHGIDFMILPETAYPFIEPVQFRELPRQYSLFSLREPTLIGMAIVHGYGDKRYLTNSAVLFDRELKVVNRYDKSHLVPFGEYVPFKKFIPFAKALTAQSGDFKPGKELNLLKLDSTPFGILICYESIFPGISRQFVWNGAKFLVIITNDAWFGNSSAIYQHLAMATFRAVENRVPIARAANTGITAFIDDKGQIVNRTHYDTRQNLYGELSISPDSRGPTVYTRIGDGFAVACILICVGLGVWRKR